MNVKSEQKAGSDLASLTGAEKVALLLLALGKEKAAQILKRFDGDELKLITRSASDLRPVTASGLDVLVEEFAKKFATGIKFVGTAKELEALLGSVMTEDEIAEVKSGDANKGEPIWDLVSKVNYDVLRAYLTKEHPQTAALVLSRIDSGSAAKVIGLFPAGQRNHMLCRILATRDAAEEAVNVVEDVLREELVASSNDSAAETHASIANILNKLDKAQSEDALKMLAASRPGDAETLKSMLFSFDDLVNLPQSVRTVIFDQVPIERVVLALKGTDIQLQSAILSSLASRSRRMVEAELQSGAGGAPREAAEARRLIVDIVLKMAARGAIDLKAPAGGDEEAA
jgi:flagellar motor switch protein FliG